ncbi:L,D-transpeptidase family protein [Gordonia sp. NPDC003425]
MRLLVLVVLAVMAAIAAGTGQALAAPGTTTTPTTPVTPSVSGVPQTGIPQLDEILNKLAGTGSSEPGGTAGDSSQLIVVTAPKASDTTATLTAFERGTDNTWKPVIGPTKAFLGAQGMGEPKDNVPRTPEGTFALDQAFGRQANPGTKMPYFQATREDWWDSNMKSPTYNTHVRQAKSPGGDSENLYDSGPVYDYAVNIAHNPQRVPGKASAMFLHVTNNEPTQGCVAIDREDMRKVLTWLDPAKHPKITIGVNASAPTGSGPSTTTPPTTTPPTTTPPPGGASPAPSVPGVSDILGGGALTDLLTQLVNLLPGLLGTK